MPLDLHDWPWYERLPFSQHPDMGSPVSDTLEGR
jgi:hypothetical protein